MLEGKIIRGKGIGKRLGYPTANIDCASSYNTHLVAGVYAAYAILEKIKYKAVLIIFPDMRKVETHLIEYSGPDIYGQRISVSPIQRVSSLERHSSEEELKQKITSDISLAMKVFEDIK